MQFNKCATTAAIVYQYHMPSLSTGIVLRVGMLTASTHIVNKCYVPVGMLTADSRYIIVNTNCVKVYTWPTCIVLRVCTWSTCIVLECACGQQALCESVHVVNRHCVRVCMWSTGIV